MEVHELCELMPEMSKAEFDALCADIDEHGMVEPIVTYKGKIIDGRHRYRASQLLGCDYHAEEWNGQCGSILAYIVSRNLHRRSLSKSQRAAVALDVKDRLNAEYEERRNAHLRQGDVEASPRFNTSDKTGANAQREAAAMMDVSQGYVARADVLRESAPDLFERVKGGTMTIPEAEREQQPRPTPADVTPFWRDPLVEKLERVARDFHDDPRIALLERLIDQLTEAQTSE